MSIPRIRSCRVAIAASVVALAAASLARAQDAPASAQYCDPSISPVPDTAFGYRARGERCEGIYVREVGTAIVVASFTETLDLEAASAQPLLHVEWEATDSAVRLRARGLQRRLHYRMDTTRPPSTQSFDWPTDVLGALNLAAHDVGIVGLATQPIGGQPQDVYVPLRVGRAQAPAPSHYTLALLSDVELDEVFVTLALARNDGSTELAVRSGQPLEYGYYPAQRPVEIPLGDLPAPGLYRLEIAALLRNGGSTALSLWFAHRPRDVGQN